MDLIKKTEKPEVFPHVILSIATAIGLKLTKIFSFRKSKEGFSVYFYSFY